MNAQVYHDAATWQSADGQVNVAYSYAYQPIVHASSGEVVSYEALLRGSHEESAFTTLAQIPTTDLHRFDQESRLYAISLAARLGIHRCLNLNVMPQSLFASKKVIQETMAVATDYHLPPERVILELLEGEVIHDAMAIANLLTEFRSLGGRVAIDDFGAGYSGLNLLADFQPDFIKIDRNLIHAIEGNGPRQAIVRAIVQVCSDLGIDIIAEGIETPAEFRWLREEHIQLFQGYYLAKPAFERLPIGLFSRE